MVILPGVGLAVIQCERIITNFKTGGNNSRLAKQQLTSWRGIRALCLIERNSGNKDNDAVWRQLTNISENEP